MQQIQGRTLILFFVGVAVVLAGWAWTYQLISTRQAAAFWEAEGVGQLVGAEEATAWGLGQPGEKGASAERIAGRPVLWKRDVSGAPGLVHLRHALTQDRNYRWSEVRADGPAPTWSLAIRFGQGGDALTILFDRDFAYIGRLGPDGEIRYVDSQPMQATLQKYFAESAWAGESR